jgi:hypothetical protein
VLVVLLLVLVNLSVLYLVLDPPSNGDDNGDAGPQDHPWNITVEPQVISDDIEWVGLNGRLDRPVRVVEGGKLRLDSCRLELHHEDLLWFADTFFRVEEGGMLEIEDSILEVVPSPIPDDVLVGPRWSDREIPQISRVVNLEGTLRPVLSFELQWRFNGTPLTVAVHPDPGGELVELERIDPEGPSEGWLQVEVPLEDYVNSIPRIVIYPSIYPEDVYYIKDLAVTDEGEQLPYDLPPSEYPQTDYRYYDLWYYNGFITYRKAMFWHRIPDALVDIRGHMLLIGSTFRVSTEIARSGGYNFERESIYPWASDKNIWYSVRGMHIEADHGYLEALGSTFEHAPIIANSSILDLDGCRFESAFDMVTMRNCTGLLVDNTFIRKVLPEGEGHWRPDIGRAIWAISSENNTDVDPVEITGCEFRDVELAVDLAYASASIEDCSFWRVSRLCIWDHASPRVTTWEELSARNTFQYCTGDLYMSTGTTDLYFNGSSAWDRDVTFWDTEGQPIDLPRFPSGQIIYFLQLRARLVRLDVLVEAMDVVRVVDHINLAIHGESPPYAIWEGELNITIEAGVETMDVDLFPLFEDQVGYPWDKVDTVARLLKVWPSGNATVGTYNLTFYIETGDLIVYNTSLDILLDGELVRSIDAVELGEDLFSSGWVPIEHTQFFEPGVRELQVVVSGNRIINWTHVSKEREVFLAQTFDIMRAAPSNTSEEIEQFIRIEDAVLAIDSDTTFELDDLHPANGSWYDTSLYLTGGKGAGLIFRNLTFDPEVVVRMAYFSQVDLHFVDTEIPAFQLSLANQYLTYDELIELDIHGQAGEITIENCTTNWMWLELWQHALRVSDTDGGGGIDVISAGNSTVSFHNVSDGFSDTFASGNIWSYTVTDSHFWGYNSSGFHFYADQIRTIQFSNCTFEDASLFIQVGSAYRGYWVLNVTGCDFSGTGSYFAMLWNTYRRDNWGDSPAAYPIPYGSVTGNTFSGDDTSIVLHHALYGSTFVNNTIHEGVRAWAWYWTKIELRLDLTTRNDHEYVVLEDPRFLTELRLLDNIELRNVNYFYEVTEDLGGPIVPPPLNVVARWYTAWGYELIVVDFVQADLRKDVNMLAYQVWPDPQEFLSLYIEDWPWGLEGWDGGNW